jgi:hypothetical protein
MTRKLTAGFAARTVFLALVLFAATFIGIRTWATCNTGCNFGEVAQCYGQDDTSCGPVGQYACEHDLCVVVGYINRFTFCVGRAYECLYPACTYNVGCA